MMSFTFHQPGPVPKGSQKPAVQAGVFARSPAVLMWFSVLVLLCGTSGLLANGSLFFGFPVSETATNSVPVSAAANSGGQSNAAVSVTSGTTNSTAHIATNSMDALDDKYRLAIGDRISFRIEEDEDEPKPLITMDLEIWRCLTSDVIPQLARPAKNSPRRSKWNSKRNTIITPR